MSKFGDTLIAAMQEAVAHAGGADTGANVHIPAEIDVKAIRKRLGLTQPAFASLFGFSLGALRDWEQGRIVPPQSTRAFLHVIDREPQAVTRALTAA